VELEAGACKTFDDYVIHPDSDDLSDLSWSVEVTATGNDVSGNAGEPASDSATCGLCP
jgi:hypothetical protein